MFLIFSDLTVDNFRKYVEKRGDLTSEREVASSITINGKEHVFCKERKTFSFAPLKEESSSCYEKFVTIDADRELTNKALYPIDLMSEERQC